MCIYVYIYIYIYIHTYVASNRSTLKRDNHNSAFPQPPGSRKYDTHLSLSLSLYIYIYTHTCIRTYIHTYIRTYIHTYIHAYLEMRGVCGLGKATAIWRIRRCKPAACILGLTGADARLSLICGFPC